MGPVIGQKNEITFQAWLQPKGCQTTKLKEKEIHKYNQGSASKYQPLNTLCGFQETAEGKGTLKELAMMLV